MPRIRGKIRPYKGDKTGKAWQLDYHDHLGQRHQPKFDGTKKQAEQQIERIKLKQWALKEKVIEGITEISFNEAIQQYVKYLQNRNRSKGTIDRFLTAVYALGAIVRPQDQLSTLTVATLNRFENRRLEEVEVETYKSDLRHLRAFFNWAARNRYIGRNPFDQYYYDLESRPETRDKVLTVEQVIRLLIAALEQSFEAFQISAFYLCTGMRLSEITPENFKWEWVAFSKRVFRHIDAKSHHPKKLITRRMNDLAFMILKIRESTSPRAPFDYKPDYIASQFIEPVFEKAGLKGFSSKHLRSTAAGHVYLSSGDIYAAYSFLQHSSVEVTAKNYVGLLDTEKYDSPVSLENVFGTCLQHSNKNGCKWDQMSEEEEAKICHDIIKDLKGLLLKIQKDTASDETVS